MDKKYLLPVSVVPANSQKQACEKWVLKIEPQIINRVRSDDFWTGEISENTLTDEMI